MSDCHEPPKTADSLECQALNVVRKALEKSNNPAAILYFYAFPALAHFAHNHSHEYDEKRRKLQITNLSFCHGCYSPFAPDEIQICLLHRETKGAAKIINDFLSCQDDPPRVLKILVEGLNTINIAIRVASEFESWRFEPVFAPDISGYDLVAWEDFQLPQMRYVNEAWSEVIYRRAKRGGELQPRPQSSSLLSLFQTTLSGWGEEDPSLTDLILLAAQTMRAMLENSNSLNSNYEMVESKPFSYDFPLKLITDFHNTYDFSNHQLTISVHATICKVYFEPFVPKNILFSTFGWHLEYLDKNITDILRYRRELPPKLTIVIRGMETYPTTFPPKILGYRLAGLEDINNRFLNLYVKLYYHRERGKA